MRYVMRIAESSESSKF